VHMEGGDIDRTGTGSGLAVWAPLGARGRPGRAEAVCTRPREDDRLISQVKRRLSADMVS